MGVEVQSGSSEGGRRVFEVGYETVFVLSSSDTTNTTKQPAALHDPEPAKFWIWCVFTLRRNKINNKQINVTSVF